ncbi:hypothetical protein QR680_018938 [Steinernema hermaphroditum]|uniref:Tyrosine-protein phosphatase domain-containing protein n=1 Tax=Steinernema hermaphroditum TaxID=289476 RepID=A0AA39LRV9_9BILA|nr:hypothetical protein QR680_018938 [Steinernema hermaphroditum]
MKPPEETKSEGPPRKNPNRAGRPLGKKKRTITDATTKEEVEPTVEDNGEAKRKVEGKRKTQLKASKGLGAVTPEAETAMSAFVQATTTLGIEGLKKEFADIKGYASPTMEINACRANETRNRYKDVVCLDSSRVTLTLNVPPEGDYIHANWVKLEGCDKTFIAAQGPLDTTISDFWRMVHQEGVTTILMLCRTEESGKVKCSQYWPLEQGAYQTYGSMFVNNKKVEKEDKFTTFTLEVLPEGCSNSTITKIFQMSDWPDRGVPQSSMTVLRLLKLVVAGGPCIVHCSAGVGRTGTIIAIEACIQRLMKGQQVAMKDLFMQLRNQRASSIQTEGQYCFVHLSVINYIGAKLKKFESVRKQFNTEFASATLN